MTSTLRTQWANRRHDIGVMAVIAAFFVVFFWPLLFGDRFFVTSDAFFYSYPLRTIAWNALRQGSPPFWTPLLMSGYPLLSMGQIALGYPLTWGYMFGPGYKAEVVYVLAPFLLAPAFTYCYCRQIGRSRLASLLAGLGFTYAGMMAGMLSNSGYTTNSVMWLPLMLIGIERSRSERFITSLLLTTVAYTLSVLNGHAQTFLFIGLISLGYSFFVSFGLPQPANVSTGPRGWLSRDRIKPIAVVILAIICAAGVAAFQIFETMRVTQLSIRHFLPYDVFIEGSFTLATMLRSAFLPLHYDLEVTTYVSPLALCLASIAVAFTLRNSTRERRILFWLAIGLVAWVLMLGGNSPVYKLIYHIPILNRFRVPARHSFEWTFAAAILAAYGWDFLTAEFKRRGANASKTWHSWLGILCLGLAAGVAVFWWRAVYYSTESMFYARTGYPVVRYIAWKLVFVLLLFGGLWMIRKVADSRLRTGLLVVGIVLACFPEPYMLISRWWFTAAKPASRFEVVSPSTRFLLENQPEQNRVYSRVNLFVEEHLATPSLEPLNLTAINGLRNVAGYEPLILERYSRALDNVGYDSITTRPGLTSEKSIFDSRSHVLDLLNTKFVITYANPLYAEGSSSIERDGIKFSGGDDPVDVKPGTSASLITHSIEGDILALVTSLANSADEVQGGTIAKLRIFTTDGRMRESELRAGIDTSEWAHERPDVRAVIRHGLAPVFNGVPDSVNGFNANSYLTRIDLGGPVKIARIEVDNATQGATLTIWKGSLHDSARGRSASLTNSLLGLVTDRWKVSNLERPLITRDGVELGADDEPVELNPGESARVTAPGSNPDSLVLVSSLAHAAGQPDKATVAKLRLVLTDGSLIERDIRAGIDTAEWSHQRPDVRSVVRHQLAEIFDSRQEGGANGFPAHRYWSRIPLGEPLSIASAEIVNTTPDAGFTIWKASLHDSSSGCSTPVAFTKPERWQRVFQTENVVVLQNDRALPRAWLVAEAEAIDSEESFRRIRGRESKAFNPARTALVETSPESLPILPGGPVSAGASARIVSAAPNVLTVETKADTATMLVVSEVFYPGWEATVDGRNVPIYLTDYLLRGVALPAGSHTVEMRYQAPWAKTGAIVSLITLLSLVGIAAYALFSSWRRRTSL